MIDISWEMIDNSTELIDKCAEMIDKPREMIDKILNSSKSVTKPRMFCKSFAERPFSFILKKKQLEVGQHARNILHKTGMSSMR